MLLLPVVVVAVVVVVLVVVSMMKYIISLFLHLSIFSLFIIFNNRSMDPTQNSPQEAQQYARRSNCYFVKRLVKGHRFTAVLS